MIYAYDASSSQLLEFHGALAALSSHRCSSATSTSTWTASDVVRTRPLRESWLPCAIRPWPICRLAACALKDKAVSGVILDLPGIGDLYTRGCSDVAGLAVPPKMCLLSLLNEVLMKAVSEEDQHPTHRQNNMASKPLLVEASATLQCVPSATVAAYRAGGICGSQCDLPLGCFKRWSLPRLDDFAASQLVLYQSEASPSSPVRQPSLISSLKPQPGPK